MFMPVERKSFLVTNLRTRMREVGFNNFQKYYDFIQDESATSAIEWEHLVDRLTVHETRFFRHAKSIEYITEQYLPVVKPATKDPVNLHIWSIGCSTGEEPYSLGIAVDDYFKRQNQKALWAVTGTDISLPSLNEAKRGIYNKRKLVEMDPLLIEKYLTRIDENRLQVNEQIRRRICFAQLNVQQIHESPLSGMDVIFCQNLLIYFDKTHREQIVAGMVDRVVDGGIILLGPGEMYGWSHPNLEKIVHPKLLAYRKHDVGRSA